MTDTSENLVPVGFQVAVNDDEGRERIRKLALHYKRRACKTRRFRRSVRVNGVRIPILVLVVYQLREKEKDPE